MSSDREICEFCHKEQFKYTCPKCNALYCSVACYKSPAHLKCSEEFFKNCIQEELVSEKLNSSEDVRKMYEILKRIRELDAGVQSENFADGLEENLDSDDEQPDDIEVEPNEQENNEEDDIAARMQNIDINDADEVWQRLTPAEREDFERMVECGDIMRLLPNYNPWWCQKRNSKIVDLTKRSDEHGATDISMPNVAADIPLFEEICKKLPSPCLHYNLWNILAAYACIVRFYAGEHVTNADVAVAHMVNLSATLKYGTNFEYAEDAIISVEMEAITTANGAGTSVGGAVIPSLVESRNQLQNDARQLMSMRQFKLAALSDIKNLMELAKKLAKCKKGAEQAEFQKLFALCNGSVELNRAKLQQLSRKITFLLSYVKRESENDLQ